MKRRELVKQLTQLGWYPVRNKKHEFWSNGTEMEAVPNHREIDENLAKKILRTAWRNPNPNGVKK
jgi:mRNA interferase HicA